MGERTPREHARAILDGYDLPPEVELWPGKKLTTEMIADSLRVYLGARHERITDEEAGPMGVSKVRGRPHLLAGTDWPEGFYFEAQLDLAEIAANGLWPWMPSEGLLTLFFDPSAKDMAGGSRTAAKALLQPSASLALADPPAKSALPYGGEYYEEHFLEQPQRLHLEPRFAVGYTDLIPADLLGALEEGLGFPRDDEAHGAIGSAPVTYQDENEAELFADEDHDWSQGAPEHEEHFLLFQDDFGEGHVHFWVPPKALAEGDVSAIVATYSGT